jgi:orotidine-5'-phosphate decarboxylase
MQNISDKLIVALDVKTLEEAERSIDKLIPAGVRLFKVGFQLFTAYGPEAVKIVGEKGGRVFLDLKFKDIKNTVFSAVSSGTSLACKFASPGNAGIDKQVSSATQYPVFMMTVHAGDVEKEMLQAAVNGASEKAKELNIERPKIVGVTVLTDMGQTTDTADEVLKRAMAAKEAGLDGVVCSVQEAADVRKACGKNFIIVTPGIRPQGAQKHDQKRAATPQEAMKAGANFIVVGRPILEAKNPAKAAEEILKDLL